MDVRDGDFDSGARGKEAVAELGSLLREREKTKRLLIGAACILFIVASLVVVFAPAGKETLSLVLGAALLVIALGAIGAATFRIKIPGIEVHTNHAVGSVTARQRADDDMPA